jgi:hypothetical protein
VVTIQEDNPFSPAGGDTGISRRALAPIPFVTNKFNPRITIGGNRADRIVLGGVVDHNELEVGVVLGEATLHGATDLPLPVVHGDDNAE